MAPAALHGGLVLMVAIALVVPLRAPDLRSDRTTTTVLIAAQDEEPVLYVAVAELLDPRPGDFTRPVPAPLPPTTTTTYLRARPA